MAKLKRHHLRWIAFSLIFILLAMQIVWFWQWKQSGKICHGVTINGIPVGLMETQEARDKVNAIMEQWLEETGVNLANEDGNIHINAKDIASYDVEEAVWTAGTIGHTGTLLQQFFKFIVLSVSSTDVSSAARINWQSLVKKLENTKEAFEESGENASILSFNIGDAIGRRIIIKPGHPGKTLQVEETAQRVYNAIMNNATEVEPIIVTREPEITEKGLRSMEDAPIKAVRALLTSSPTEGEISQDHVNIETIGIDQVCANLEPVILRSGESLSIKSYLGYESWDTTMLDEGVTIHIPSLLYECAARAELTILEHHSGVLMKGDQYSPGQEAIVADDMDLEIRNDMTYPVILNLSYEEGKPVSRLMCEVYRTPMEFNTHLKSVITYSGDDQVVEVYRVYTSEKGGDRGRELVDEVVYKP